MVAQELIPLDEISAEPDIFPVFGNVEDAVRFHLPALVEYVRSIRGEPKRTNRPVTKTVPQPAKTSSTKTAQPSSVKKPLAARTKRPQPARSTAVVETPIEVEGKLPLYPAVRGFHNPGNSCFMDSSLVGMFAFEGSPFYDNLVMKDLIYKEGELLCANDVATDKSIRLRIQEALRNDVEQLIASKPKHVCTNLRKLIGDTCRLKSTQPGEGFGKRVGANMSEGIHDPGEFYTRLLGALNYQPMRYETYYEYQVGSEWYRISQIIRADTDALRLVASDEILKGIKWPQTWDGVESELEKIVVDQNTLAELKAAGVSENVLVELRRLGSKRDIIRRERLSLQRADCFVISIDRRDYSKAGETAVNTRRLEVDHEMKVTLDGGEQKTFVLQAVVYPPGAGHYQCLLKSGIDWFDYNDLSTTKPVTASKIGQAAAIRTINTRGVLLFYF
jgi:hypothetical protein